MGDAVAKAVAYARRATSKTPMSEGRLRRRLADRDHPDAVIEHALERCRAEGIVDDASFARALVEEGRRKGHAPLRIRKDLEKREFSTEVVDEVLATIGDRDLEAAAFGVARRRAEQLRGVDAETAYRRLVSYLARRGYTQALSRKVARQAVFDDRESERTAGR
jgi:regulatory protein